MQIGARTRLVLFVAGLTLSSITAATADSQVPVTPAPPLTTSPQLCLVRSPEDGWLPVRTEPRGALVQRLINGTLVNIIRIDRVSDVRGYPWAYITDRTGKNIGWVFENYLACG